MKYLYCYHKQQRTVDALLRPFMARGEVMLSAVDSSGDKLKGTSGATFVSVTHHKDAIPTALHQILVAYGVVVWHLDDSHARSAAERKLGL